MSRIITISRQFGSGGREIGKRLAEELGMPYFDKEIAAKTAEESGFSIDYIEENAETGSTLNCPYTFGRTFTYPVEMPSDTVHACQNKIILEMAEKGDGVFVGRCSDYILEDHNPIKVLIFSTDIKTRINRCYEKGNHDNQLSDKDLEKEIKKIDKARAKYYNFFTGNDWMDVKNYDIAINTSKFDVEHAVEVIKGLLK